MQTCSMKASQYTKKSDDNASDLEIGPQVQLAEFDFDEPTCLNPQLHIQEN